MRKIAVILMLFTLIAKGLGFVRELVLSYYYGTSNISDAFLIARTIPEVLFAIVGTGIATAFIPIYTRVLSNKGKDKAEILTNNTINFTILLSTFIVVNVMLFTTPIVKAFASGFDTETLDMAVKFTRFSIVSIYFTGLIQIYTSYLQLKEKYIAPTLISVPLNIFLISSIILSYNYGNLLFLPLGMVTAGLFQYLLLIPFLKQTQYKYTLVFDFKSESFKMIMLLALPVILSSSIDELNVLVDRTLASRISEGGISAINYAHRLKSLVKGIITMSILAILFPKISKMATQKNLKELKLSIIKTINGLNIIIIPISIYILLFSSEIVSLLYGRGAFTIQGINMTSNALFYYSFGLIGFSVSTLLIRTFFALNDSKTPMINSTIAMSINVVLNFVLSIYLGLGGLALATSIAAIISTILLYFSLQRKIGTLNLKQLIRPTISILIVSIITGFVIKLLYDYLSVNNNANIVFVLMTIFGALIYLMLLILFRVEDLKILLKIKRG